MEQLEKGSLTIPITLGMGKTAIHLKLQVQKNSPTWLFLEKYKKEINLRKLLCGEWQEHLYIIREVDQMFSSLEWQKGLKKGIYDEGGYPTYGQDADGNVIVENFNDILYWLFVNQMYDGDKRTVHFDKTAFVRERGMEICPYCGRQYIDMAEVDGSVSKPYIDHFLPKSKYPFLAMSYMNLIPGCNTCNEVSNKGTLDPLTHPYLESYLLNPHVFRDSAVTFEYNYNYQGENNENNFIIKANAENNLLEFGYLEVLKLREFYSHRRLELKDMYRNFTKATNSMKKYLKFLGLKDYFLNDVEERTLGYRLNDDEAPKRQMYKFKKDIFENLKKNYGF
jgi:hypothetical protein